MLIKDMALHRRSGRKESMAGLTIPFAFEPVTSNLVSEAIVLARETLRAAGKVTTERFPVLSPVRKHMHFSRIVAFEPPVAAGL